MTGCERVSPDPDQGFSHFGAIRAEDRISLEKVEKVEKVLYLSCSPNVLHREGMGKERGEISSLKFSFLSPSLDYFGVWRRELSSTS
jgi:hypothetical protein